LEGKIMSAMRDMWARWGDTEDLRKHKNELAKGAGKAIEDEIMGMGTTVDHPDEMVKAIGKSMSDAYQRGGGGARGAVYAADVVNPFYHAAVEGYKADQALKRGDYETAGRQGTHAAIDTGKGVGMAAAAGSAGLALGEVAAALAPVEAATEPLAAGAAEGAGGGAGPKPLFENLSQGEIDAGFDNAKSGPHLELPGQDPGTGQGLRDVKIKFDPNKPIAFQDKMVFRGIEDAPGPKVEVRTHSANPNAPEGTYSHDNPTTQINAGKRYRLPDGTWKIMDDSMSEAEKAAAHMNPTTEIPDSGGATPTEGGQSSDPNQGGSCQAPHPNAALVDTTAQPDNGPACVQPDATAAPDRNAAQVDNAAQPANGRACVQPDATLAADTSAAGPDNAPACAEPEAPPAADPGGAPAPDCAPACVQPEAPAADSGGAPAPDNAPACVQPKPSPAADPGAAPAPDSAPACVQPEALPAADTSAAPAPDSAPACVQPEAQPGPDPGAASAPDNTPASVQPETPAAADPGAAPAPDSTPPDSAAA
jgi:hypothetical protein